MSDKQSVRERPILFSGPMVRAILDGRKSMTRRVVKPQLGAEAYWVQWEGAGWRAGGLIGDIPLAWRSKIPHCPYGEVGNLLWCRETWQYSFPPDAFDYERDMMDESWRAREQRRRPERCSVHYRATERLPLIIDVEGEEIGWKPSIHMPRWASRLTLRITNIRVERLQEISEEDAIAEGSQCAGVPASLTNRGAFAKLWDSINGKKHPWSSNPCVWVISFERVEK